MLFWFLASLRNWMAFVLTLSWPRRSRNSSKVTWKKLKTRWIALRRRNRSFWKRSKLWTRKVIARLQVRRLCPSLKRIWKNRISFLWIWNHGSACTRASKLLVPSPWARHLPLPTPRIMKTRLLEFKGWFINCALKASWVPQKQWQKRARCHEGGNSFSSSSTSGGCMLIR